MNFTYFKFLFATTVKKRPVWITLILMLLTSTMFLIVLPAVSRINILQVWANTAMMICQSFLGMIMALFTAVLGIHIFQDGNTEGTELIVISKPIKRYKITLTKYLVFGTFCLLANLLVVIISMFTAFLPSTEHKFYWGLVVSMLIGNAITMMFYGAIAIIMTVKVAKTGVIVTNVVVSLILLIYQMLAMLVFVTPAKSLARHGVIAPTYTIQNRDLETGEYTEDSVVKFGLTDLNPALAKDKRFSGYSYTDVQEYWKDVILAKNPTPIINATDIAGQLALTYLSVGIDDYSYRQASRNFALTKQYKYNLTVPASPEITTQVGSKKSLPFVYVGLNQGTTILLGQQFIYPTHFGFSGVAPGSSGRIKGFTDKIPVGTYFPASGDVVSKNVYFEKADWDKYMDNFKVIYDHIFNYKYYNVDLSTIEKDQAFLLPTIWSSTNQTQKRYYQLAWACLMGVPAATDPTYFGDDKKDFVTWNEKTFDINNVDDLNERFIQFKYAAYIFTLKEQQELLKNGPVGELAQVEKTKWTAAINKMYEDGGLYTALGVKHKGKNDNYNFLMIPDRDIASYVEENTEVPDLNLMKATHDELVNDENVTKEQMTQSSLATYAKTSTIFDKCCYPTEQYLFASTTKPERSAEAMGNIHTVQDTWYSYWDTTNPFAALCKGQNMTYFYYTTTPRIDYWVFAVIWATIALAVYAASFVLYIKYDFH